MRQLIYRRFTMALAERSNNNHDSKSKPLPATPLIVTNQNCCQCVPSLPRAKVGATGSNDLEHREITKSQNHKIRPNRLRPFSFKLRIVEHSHSRMTADIRKLSLRRSSWMNIPTAQHQDFFVPTIIHIQASWWCCGM